MDLRSAFASCVRWCVRFRGRATRREFWLLFLGCLGANGLAVALDDALLLDMCLLLVVPLVSVGVRRLHDTGRAGGWLWLALFVWGLPVAGVFLAGRSEPHVNRYGPPPLSLGIAAVPADRDR
ncbi:DUF805 domain-containing protein [Amycolatopsis australiensis]|uniref:Uncharacterized membrane protein YhaH, DUF805 family n=1 Tax=Amycolatopsis australiensis TaxID=546364 RepID=A0A1K1S2M0_9PSEU|nr:DUF805 domain-containing protein [Amycolatopsis australiensis]SFW78327.1 Uncharacterized membrane protein YhaH, DUF805 family [Amycolatopsis australiensis]